MRVDRRDVGSDGDLQLLRRNGRREQDERDDRNGGGESLQDGKSTHANLDPGERSNGNARLAWARRQTSLVAAVRQSMRLLDAPNSVNSFRGDPTPARNG